MVVVALSESCVLTTSRAGFLLLQVRFSPLPLLKVSDMYNGLSTSQRMFVKFSLHNVHFLTRSPWLAVYFPQIRSFFIPAVHACYL
jgi:hypothetical protein